MREMNVSHEEKWCLPRSTGEKGQKRNRNPTDCLTPTIAVSNAPYVKQSRSAA